MTTLQTTWLVVALLLMASEMAIPEMFLLWLGFAALAVFALLLGVPDLPIVWQGVAFGVFSALSIVVYLKFFRHRNTPSDRPLLNRRGEQLIGQIHPLDVAIVDGRYAIPIPKGSYVVGVEPVDGNPVPAASISFTAQIGNFFGQMDFNEEFWNNNKEETLELRPWQAKNVPVAAGSVRSGVNVSTTRAIADALAIGTDHRARPALTPCARRASCRWSSGVTASSSSRRTPRRRRIAHGPTRRCPSGPRRGRGSRA